MLNSSNYLLFKKAGSKTKLFYLKLANNAVFRNVLIVGFLNILIKGLGFYKETVVAGSFGLSTLLDTFYIAVLIPSFINTVFVSQLNNIFIPNYIADIKDDPEKRGAFQSVSFILITGIALVLYIMCVLCTDTYLSVIFRGHNAVFYKLILKQFYWLAPCLFFWGFSSLLNALLLAKNHFLVTTIYPVLTSLTVVVCVVFFREKLGVSVLALGMLSGSVLEFLALLIYAIYLKELRFALPKLNPNTILMINQMPSRIISALLVGLNPFVDQFFAAQLHPGSISAINYGTRIPSFLSSFLILALGNVLLPYFSEKVTDNMANAYRVLFKILKYTFVTTCVICAAIFLFSSQIVHVAFERGKFSPHDTSMVSVVQQIFVVYIPFYTCSIVLLKFLTSINKNSFMILTSLISLILNFVFDLILVKKYDVYGLAVSTTITIVFSSLGFLIYTIQQRRQCDI